MPANAFDRYYAGTSLIHQLDPRVKLVVVLCFIVSNVLLPDGAWLAFGLAFGLVLAAGLLAGLGPWYLLRRSFVALPFALAAFSVIFALPGRALADLSFGPWQLIATDAGLIRFVSIVLRSWIAVQAAVLLTATTRFPDLLHGLRYLRLPGIMVAIVGFMYRYLAVLTDETTRLLRAREARSARRIGGSGGGSVFWRARVAGNMAGQLLLRSFERSDRVYNAMLARSYAGEFLTINPHRMRLRDWLAGTAAIGLIMLPQLVARAF